MEDPKQTYRTLLFLVEHGDKVATTVAVGALLLGVLVAVVNTSLWAAPLGIVASAFLYLIMRSYVEMVRVIVDMLLPK